MLRVLASLAVVAGVVGSSAQAATRSFSCTQTTSSRGTQRQAVQGTLDSANVPHNVVVTRTATGTVEISSANPVLDPGYSGGYWKRTYGLDQWNLGTVNNGYPPKTFHLMLPPSPGSTFTALLNTDFLNSGYWAHWMACTAS